MLKKIPNTIIDCLILIFLIIIIFGRFIFNLDTNIIGGTDIGCYFYWYEKFVKEMFLSGSFPLWNPYTLSGHPFFANPQTFVMYPITLIYVILPLPWAFNLDTLIHLYIAATGMYFYVKMITHSRYAGLAAAIVFSLNGYFMWRIFLGHITLIHAAALIPWIFFYIEKSVRFKKIIFSAISGIILGIQILGGDPQISYYTSIFLTIYFFIRWFSESRTLCLHNVYMACKYFLVIPLIAFGISAVQILPTMEFRSLSSRSMNTYEYATFSSFDPLHLFHYIAPYYISPYLRLTPEFGCYVGILSLVLAFIGGAFSRYREYSIPIIIMLIISATFILGNNTPLYYAYYQYLPLLSTFRVPARCIVIFNFMMSILIGFGLQHLYEIGLNKFQRLLAIAVLVCILICIFVAISEYQDFGASGINIPSSSTSIGYALLFTVLSFVIISTFQFIHNKQIVAGLFITILFIDIYLVCSPLIPEIHEKELLKEENFEQIFKGDLDFYRVSIPGFGDFLGTLYGLPNLAIKFHYYNINGNTPFMLKEYSDFIYGMAYLSEPMESRHTFAGELFAPDKVMTSKILGVKYALIPKASGYSLIGVKDFQPRAILIRDVIFTSQIEDQLRILKQSTINTRKIILLDESDKNYVLSKNKSAGSPDQDKIVFTNYTPNRLDLRSDSPSSTMLLLSELYYPGWKAYVDGKDVRILRADYLLRAVKLDAGKHSITMVYRPNSLYIGSVITLFTILFLNYLFLRRKNTISFSLTH